MIRPLNLLISDLWHISLTALSSKPHSRYDRMLYIKNSLIKHYPNNIEGLTQKQIWHEIEKELENV